MGLLGKVFDRFSQKGEHYGHLLNAGRLRLEVDRAVSALNDAAIEFDAIAVQGVSGLLFGAPLAVSMDKGLIIVRRPSDTQTMTFPFDIRGDGKRVLFVDDCIRTGATFQRVSEKLDTFLTYELAGVLLYNMGWRTDDSNRAMLEGKAQPIEALLNGKQCPIIVLPDTTPPLRAKDILSAIPSSF